MSCAKCLKQHAKGSTLLLHAQPRSSRIGPLALHGDSLKWGLASSPVDSKANEELIESLAKHLRIPKKQVQLLRGEKSRRKLYLIKSMDLETIAQLLELEQLK